MEFTLLYTPLALFFIFLILKRFSTRKYHLPPNPARPLPIVGHLHLLKPPLHRTLRRFSQMHGPIFSLQIGVRRVVVVSSPHLVEECFTAANDVVLSNRPHVLVDFHIGYRHTTIAGVPYSRQWRNLRRLAVQEVLSSARLNAFSRIREDEIRRMLQTLTPRKGEHAEVRLRPVLSELVFNIVARMLTGKRYYGDEKEKEKFWKMVSEVFEQVQSSNPEDVLPFLRWIDYRGLKKKLAALGEELDDFHQGLLDEQRKEDNKNTIIGHLLSLQELDPDFYTDQTIKGFMIVMLLAGTDTSAVTIEWAMSVLLNHPEKLHRAKTEIDNLIGTDRLINESDLSKLPYLQNIISETLRLFPASPLLVPHEAASDCTIGGYDVPRGTILLVNAWAIHRDPKIWDDPTSFSPERFEAGEHVMGPKLIPFGLGRRACPGMGMAQRVVGLALGSLIQCFEWKRVDEGLVDLREGKGVPMPRVKPLEAMCEARDVLRKVLLQEA